MGRPALPVGTWGKVRRTELGPDRWEASTRFRDFDGKTREVTAVAATGAAAERTLVVNLTGRITQARGHGDITGETRMSQLSALWLEEIALEDRIMPQTLDRYRGIVARDIDPALGSLKVRELTVSRADRFLKAHAKEHPSHAQSIKQVLGQIMSLAARHDAIANNPVRQVARLRTVKKEIRALNEEQLVQVMKAVREWRTKPGPDGRMPPGPRPSGDLPDIVDLFLATGLRINEVLALRWQDIDLAATRPTLTVNGTLVQLQRVGIVRQEWPKSEASRRTLYLPAFAVEVLLRRRVTSPPNDRHAVFATRNGTWVSAFNVRRAWRSVRKEIDLEWVTPHAFRKTVATMIEREVDSKAAAAQLGHASESMTEGYYIQKTHIAPDFTGILERNVPRPD